MPGGEDDRGSRDEENFLQQLSRLGQSSRSFQESAQRAGSAASANYTLIGAIVMLGGAGYAVDRWLRISPWGLIVGLFLGLAVGFWALAKTVWRIGK